MLARYSEARIARDSKETRENTMVVDLLGCEPSDSRWGCKDGVNSYRMNLKVNGKPLNAPIALLQEIGNLYLSLKTNADTEGLNDNIEELKAPRPICAMAGPSLASFLGVHYQTLNATDLYKVEKAEFTEISVQPENCLFQRKVAPKSQHAQKNTLKLRTILRTLGLLNP